MRLIGTVANQKQAFSLYSYLLSEGIHSTYESSVNEETKKEEVRIWIYEEEAIEAASTILQEFKEHPDDPKFAKAEFPETPPLPADHFAEKKEEAKPTPKPWREAVSKRKIRSYPLTYAIIFICVILYFWNTAQQIQMIKSDGRISLQLGMTPLQQVMMFDYPKSAQEISALLEKYTLKSTKELKSLPQEEVQAFNKAASIPTWKGWLALIMNRIQGQPTEAVDGPLFEKIKTGEYWRLFTPCLLHGGLLHILFNMAWTWILLRQVEERLSKFKILLLIVIVAIAANVAQYMVSGPFFLGFSGVVCGLVGFIWVRQKVAPWEGYPLQRSTIIFILIFIGAMFALELVTLGMAIFADKEIAANIANTAHIVGGLSGALLARIPFFSRGMK